MKKRTLAWIQIIIGVIALSSLIFWIIDAGISPESIGGILGSNFDILIFGIFAFLTGLYNHQKN